MSDKFVEVIRPCPCGIDTKAKQVFAVMAKTRCPTCGTRGYQKSRQTRMRCVGGPFDGQFEAFYTASVAGYYALHRWAKVGEQLRRVYVYAPDVKCGHAPCGPCVLCLTQIAESFNFPKGTEA